MENASKALIIAGAILLSILIIGLGMSVYNSSTSVTGGINLDATEIRAHNSQFTAYEGRQKGSEIKTLLGMIQSNNAEYDDRQITVCFSDKSTDLTAYDEQNMSNEGEPQHMLGSQVSDISTIRGKVKSKTTYSVTFETNNSNLIVYCGIKVYESINSPSDDDGDNG